MNNSIITRIIYTFFTILMLILIVKFIFWILPFVIIGGVAIWAYFKLKKNTSKNSGNNYSQSSNKRHNQFDNGAIDVEFEEVDK